MLRRRALIKVEVAGRKEPKAKKSVAEVLLLDMRGTAAVLDPTTPIGRGFIAFLSALAEDERQRIVKRANDGRVAARKRGVHMGRKPKLTELQRRVARERVANGESARSIAEEWGVAHTTVARAVA